MQFWDNSVEFRIFSTPPNTPHDLNLDWIYDCLHCKGSNFHFVWELVFEMVFLWFSSFVLVLLYQGERSWLLIYVGGSGKHFTILKENYAYQMISNFCEPIHLAPKFMFQPSPTICSFQTSKIQLWLIRVSNSYLSDNFLRHYFLARWAHVHTSWSW